MSTLSINSVSNPYQTYGPSNANQRQTDFQSLAAALQSGNLSAAQSAFAALQQTFQNQGGPPNGPSSNQSNPVAADFQKLANALNSNNLSSAQQAFVKLQQDLQGLRGGHHHHYHGSGSNASQTTSATTTSPTTDSDGDNDGSGKLNVQA